MLKKRIIAILSDHFHCIGFTMSLSMAPRLDFAPLDTLGQRRDLQGAKLVSRGALYNPSETPIQRVITSRNKE